MSGHIFFSALPSHFPEDQVPRPTTPEKKERISLSALLSARCAVESAGKTGQRLSFLFLKLGSSPLSYSLPRPSITHLRLNTLFYVFREYYKIKGCFASFANTRVFKNNCVPSREGWLFAFFSCSASASDAAAALSSYFSPRRGVF